MGPLSLTFTIGAVIGMILFVPIMIYLVNILKLVEKLDRRLDILEERTRK